MKTISFLILYFSILNWVAGTPQNNHSPDFVSLNSHVSYFLENEELDIHEALKKYKSGQFESPKSSAPLNFGTPSQIVWLSLEIPREIVGKKILHFQCPYIDYIDLYKFENDRLIRVEKTGKHTDLSTRGGLKPKDFAWQTEFSSKEKTTILFRIDTKAPLLAPIYVRSYDEYVNYRSYTYILYGIYFGILIIMILYNLIIYFSLKDNSFLIYVLSVFCTLVIFSTSNGFLAKYLAPNNALSLFYLAEIFMCIIIIPTSLFAITFLELKKNSPHAYYIMLYMLTLSIPCALAVRFFESAWLASFIIAIHTVALLTVGIISLVKKNPFAKFYVIAWSAYLIGGLMVTLRNIGLIDSNVISDNGAEIGSAMEVCLLAFALAHKYRTIRKDKEQLQRDNYQLVKDQNDKLSLLVEERTHKLNETIEELNTTLNYLNENQQELEVKNNNITSSINYALNIQQAILPNDNRIARSFRDYAKVYMPKDIVSGDFLFYEEQNGLKYFAVADCTGHGVPGAIMTMLGYNLLYELIKVHQLTDPAQILTELDEKLKKRIQQEGKIHDGLDISLIVVDQESDKLHFSGAINGLYLIDTNCNTHFLKGTRRNIGDQFRENTEFQSHSLDLSSIHWVYLFSDGFQDQFNDLSNEKYTSKRLKKLLKYYSDKKGNEQSILLRDEFEEWKGRQDQLDDVTVAGIKFNECTVQKAS